MNQPGTNGQSTDEGGYQLKSLHKKVQQDIERLVDEWLESGYLKKGDLFVIGCSTSEVAGEAIGTSGSEQIAEYLFQALQRLRNEAGIHLVFQCCEHLNRALVIERETLHLLNLDEVNVIPTPQAGGSMASYAYQNMTDSIVVEKVKVHAGIDIGDTMIGMHLKEVAVPLRFNQSVVGHARITGARTRPKLIGGERAIYHRV